MEERQARVGNHICVFRGKKNSCPTGKKNLCIDNTAFSRQHSQVGLQKRASLLVDVLSQIIGKSSVGSLVEDLRPGLRRPQKCVHMRQSNTINDRSKMTQRWEGDTTPAPGAPTRAPAPPPPPYRPSSCARARRRDRTEPRCTTVTMLCRIETALLTTVIRSTDT